MDETKKLILDLLTHARSGEHTKFEQLRFFNGYLAARVTRRATKKVVDILEYSSNTLFKKYCKAVGNHQADINLLLAYKQLQQVVSFYKEELNIINAILADYKSYLAAGNFLKAFIFGEERDLWNIR